MPNNKEYQDAYNKQYYQANKEYLDNRRKMNKKKKQEQNKLEKNIKIIEHLKTTADGESKTITTTKITDDSITINHGNFIITW